MKVRRMSQVPLAGRRVLIREDLNVPVANGVVTSDARIRAALPTLRLAMEEGAKVFVMSHLGRPEEGVYDEQFSLAPVARTAQGLAHRPRRRARAAGAVRERALQQG
jgi:phosphoglycerate kinase